MAFCFKLSSPSGLSNSDGEESSEEEYSDDEQQECEHINTYDGICQDCGQHIKNGITLTKEDYQSGNIKLPKINTSINSQLIQKIKDANVTSSLFEETMKVIQHSSNMRYDSKKIDIAVIAYIYSAMNNLKIDCSPQRIMIQCRIERTLHIKTDETKKMKNAIRYIASGKIVGSPFKIYKTSLFIKEFLARDDFPILGKEITNSTIPCDLEYLANAFDAYMHLKPQRKAAALIQKYYYPKVKAIDKSILEYFRVKQEVVVKVISDMKLAKITLVRD